MKYILLLFICIFTNELSMYAQGLSIEGRWKYKLEDNKEFSNPEFNDSGWDELENLSWQDKLNTTANRLLWIRKSVFIPSTLKKELEKTGVLTLSMGKIKQSDQTYLNGKLIGSTGSGASYRNYLIREDDILWDKQNTFAIRIGHWGRFSMSITPILKAAEPDYFFVYSASLKNADPKKPVLNKEITYQLSVENKSEKIANGLLKADFYDFEGIQIFSNQKTVNLSVGANSFDFSYKSSSPFVKVVYSLSIPDYDYKGEWNGEFGYENIVYKNVEPVVSDKVNQNYQPGGLENVQVNGWLGDKLNANIEQRLHKVDEDALLAGFINRPGVHSWIGEHIGKFLEAACNAYANSGDLALKIQIDRNAQQLIAAQLENGYLGTYDLVSQWTSWDVWSHKYDMVGLLRYYELSGFKPALETCKKIGDILCLKFGDGEGQKDIIKAGAHVGMAATSVLDPMTDLYRFTGDKKYLDFCYYIIKSYNNPYGPRIISTLDSIGRVDKTANAKAYEMLTNLVGVAKLYRITNDDKFLKPVIAAWSDIVANRLYITGTTSSFEHFQDDQILPAERGANMGEGCVTTTWIQFNYQLFSIFGEMKYLDEIERSVYNHLTGAENPLTGGVSYYTPLMGAKPYGTNITCCMSSVPRAIAMVPLFANGKIDQSPAILFYQPGDYKTILNDAKTSVEFKTETSFPGNGNVVIIVNPEKSTKFSVLFRKPYWAENFILKVNDKKQKFLVQNLVAIERLWKNGDRVEISFDMPVKVLDGGISYPNMIALQRGPQVLVFDQALNSVRAEDVSISPESINLLEDNTVLPKKWIGSQAYQLDAIVDGNQQKIILVPFADAGQTGGVISTWLKKDNSK
ncbi:MAG: glycoside hydrolase family 127 protein [Prolixibacteraceae bacterium]|jgi:DUF1680 family protein|nr:glycoside hydrolase family 127 protein [Prolixibacteraceae bacterium]